MSRADLTKETRRDWATQNRRDKDGTHEIPGGVLGDGATARMRRREAEWAAWALRRDGHPAPPHGVVPTIIHHLDGRRALQFVHRTTHRPWNETLRGPRGGFKGYRYHPEEHVDEPVGPPVILPPHCVAVRFADEWHAAHQMGLPDLCETAGWNKNWRQCIPVQQAQAA